MAKIIKNPNGFKPITCQCCGCEYEYEIGDKTITQFMRFNNDTRKVRIMLACPICDTPNVLFDGYIKDIDIMISQTRRNYETN